MHPNPVFQDKDIDKNLTFARERGFGTLAVNGQSRPLLSHIPFRISSDNESVEIHLVRSNPIARMNFPLAALISVTGADSYVSPDWYDLENQVPTWNYVALHIHGRLERMPDDQLRRVIDELSTEFESRLEPKPIWNSQKMDSDSLARLMRMIIPFRLRIEQVEGTWKLNQNKPKNAVHGAIKGVSTNGIGSEVESLSRLMQQTLEK